jgi:hypothetical protein
LGLDPTGSHIYEVHDGESGCFDAIGYAAIGAGARYARAHFMMSSQVIFVLCSRTLWATYLAKKRSEVAPGVGEATDIAMLGPQLGGNVYFSKNPAIIKQLESVYKRTRQMEEKARKTHQKKWWNMSKNSDEMPRKSLLRPSRKPRQKTPERARSSLLQNHDNPRHRESFTSLLRAAVRKRTLKD